MRKLPVVALLLAVATLVAADASPAFDPRDRITVDIKDAKIADLVTTLGALANMPVYIDPDVSGSVTLQVEAMPFEDVLKIVSKQAGVWLRIEGGNKLVASRSRDYFFGAVTVPERFRNAPRIPISRVREAVSNLPPLYVRTRWNGVESCARLEFSEGELPTVSVPLSEDASAPALYVTQFGVDPVSKTRYVALDGAMRGVVAVGGPGQVATREKRDASGSLFVLATEKPLEPCKPQTVRGEPPRREVTLSFVARETGPDGPGEIVMATRLTALAGTTVKARSGVKDAEAGRQRELVLAAYVSRDGSWVAPVLTATAIWIDPADGGEYFYTQTSSVAGVEPPFNGPGPALVATIGAGAATPRAIELTLLGGEGGRDKADTPEKR